MYDKNTHSSRRGDNNSSGRVVAVMAAPTGVGGGTNNRMWWLGCRGNSVRSGDGGNCIVDGDGKDSGGDSGSGIMLVVAIKGNGDDSGGDGDGGGNYRAGDGNGNNNCKSMVVVSIVEKLLQNQLPWRLTEPNYLLTLILSHLPEGLVLFFLLLLFLNVCYLVRDIPPFK